MANRRKLLVCLLCASLGVMSVALLSRGREARYRGKALSEWVGIYSLNSYGASFGTATTAEREEAGDAIRHIGTNAIPLLLSLLDHPEPGVWRRGGDLTRSWPDWITGHAAVRWLRKHHPVILCPEDARSIADALGPIAAPAVPELVNRLSSTHWTGRRDLALYALARMSRPATINLPPQCIHSLLTAPDEKVRCAATNVLVHNKFEIRTNAPAL